MYYFFLGTTAEFIKMYPIINLAQKQGIPYKIIASGQDNLSKLTQFPYPSPQIDFVLSPTPQKTGTFIVLFWFLKTLLRGLVSFRKIFSDSQNAILLVHGDTISTLLGAILAKLTGIKVAHVEAGLRSFNYLRPFPEEICRVITSYLTDISFCPGKWAADNLNPNRCHIVDTTHNTLADSLNLLNQQTKHFLPDHLANHPFFVLVLHRQENLADPGLIKYILDNISSNQGDLNCCFILHETTKNTLHKYGLLEELQKNPQFYLQPRLPYQDFIHLLKNAKYLITDGGSNQEECSYLGLPCLILRKETERREGLNKNALLSHLDSEKIKGFMLNPSLYQRSPLTLVQSPSTIILDSLLNLDSKEI